METLTQHHVMVMLLSLGVLLGVAHILGELARRLRQPAVLGELIAGVLLGPTVLGSLAPEWSAFLFPLQGPNAVSLDTMATLAIVLFLLVAGMEVDLSTLWFRFVCSQATSVEPLPPKRSSTFSPGREEY